MQENLIAVGRLAIVYSVLSVTGVVAFLVRALSLGTATDLVRRWIVAPSSRFILWAIGIRLELPPRSAFERPYVMYTFNHNSYFDVLIITALGLRNTRCFLSEKTLKFVPVTISALAIGTLYIPTMKHAERRARFFERTTEQIRRERFSVLVSSEGVHTFVHGIAPFNDGVYRMAVEAGLAVVPVYLHIPREVNSLEGFKYKAGAIRVEVLPPVDTREWKLEHLAGHIDSVREIFVNKFNDAHAEDR